MECTICKQPLKKPLMEAAEIVISKGSNNVILDKLAVCDFCVESVVNHIAYIEKIKNPKG